MKMSNYLQKCMFIAFFIKHVTILLLIQCILGIMIVIVYSETNTQIFKAEKLLCTTKLSCILCLSLFYTFIWVETIKYGVQ